jgi:hypothetical protein
LHAEVPPDRGCAATQGLPVKGHAHCSRPSSRGTYRCTRSHLTEVVSPLGVGSLFEAYPCLRIVYAAKLFGFRWRSWRRWDSLDGGYFAVGFAYQGSHSPLRSYSPG